MARRIEVINGNLRSLPRYGGWRKESTYVLVVAFWVMKQSSLLCTSIAKFSEEHIASILDNPSAVDYVPDYTVL